MMGHPDYMQTYTRLARRELRRRRWRARLRKAGDMALFVIVVLGYVNVLALAGGL